MIIVQSFEQVKHSPCRRLVQIARWFVGQQKPGVPHQRSRKSDTLLFPAREFPWSMIPAILQINFL